MPYSSYECNPVLSITCNIAIRACVKAQQWRQALGLLGGDAAGRFAARSMQQIKEPVRGQAAVLLRQCMSKLKDDGSTWSQLGAHMHAESKVKVLQLLEGVGLQAASLDVWSVLNPHKEILSSLTEIASTWLVTTCSCSVWML